MDQRQRFAESRIFLAHDLLVTPFREVYHDPNPPVAASSSVSRPLKLRSAVAMMTSSDLIQSARSGRKRRKKALTFFRPGWIFQLQKCVATSFCAYQIRTRFSGLRYRSDSSVIPKASYQASKFLTIPFARYSLGLCGSVISRSRSSRSR